MWSICKEQAKCSAQVRSDSTCAFHCDYCSTQAHCSQQWYAVALLAPIAPHTFIEAVLFMLLAVYYVLTTLLCYPQQPSKVHSYIGSLSVSSLEAMSHAGVPAQPDLDSIRELEALRHAFQAAPGNHRYCFQHLFLNVVDHPAARVRPQGMLMNPLLKVSILLDVQLCVHGSSLKLKVNVLGSSTH